MTSKPIQIARSFTWQRPVRGFRVHTISFPAWRRSPEGYEYTWNEQGERSITIGRKHGERCIAPSPDTEFESCRPLEDSALFVRFAGLDCGEVAVVEFARKAGLLWLGETATRYEDGELPDGESLGDWYWQIRDMAFGLRLWEASRSKSDDSFRRAVRSREFDIAWKSANLASDSGGDPSHEHPRNYHKRVDALRAVHALILRNLGESDGRVKLTFAEALPKNRYVLEIGPDSLKTGLWLQFATALAEDAHYRPCAFERCGGFIDATERRISRKYCSSSCRTKQYNLRKEASATKKRAPQSNQGKD